MPPPTSSSLHDLLSSAPPLNSPDTLSHLTLLRDTLAALPLAPLPSLSAAALRAHLFHLLSSDPAPRLALSAASLYLALLLRAPLAFDLPTLAAALRRVARLLADASISSCPTCRGPARPGRACCACAAQPPASDLRAFWRLLRALVAAPAFDVRRDGVVPAVVGAYADLLKYAHAEADREVGVQGVEELARRGGVAVHNCLYKAAFGLLRLAPPKMPLAAPNRAALVAVLVAAAKRELQAVQDERGGSSAFAARAHGSSDARDDVGGATAAVNAADADKGEGEIEESAGEDDNGDEAKENDIVHSWPRLPVVRFLQLSCLHVVDRTDQRAALSAVVAAVLSCLGPQVQSYFADFILRLALHREGRVRLFAAEFSAVLLCAPSPVGPDAADRLHVADPLPLVRMLSARANDVVPAVRVKAIASLTEALRAAVGRGGAAARALLDVVGFSYAERLRDAKSRVRKIAVEFVGLACQVVLRGAAEDSLEDDVTTVSREGVALSEAERQCVRLVGLLKLRGVDTVSTVRLSAVTHVTGILLSMSETMHVELQHKLVSLWCAAVLPRVDDTDARCKERALRATESVLFPFRKGPASAANEGEWEVSSYAEECLPELFLSELGGENYANVELGRKAIHAVSEKGAVRKKEVEFLCERIRIGGARSSSDGGLLQKGAWIALAEIASCGHANLVKNALGIKAVLGEAMRLNSQSACKVASHLAPSMSEADRARLSASLQDALLASAGVAFNKAHGRCVDSAVALLASLERDIGSQLLDRCEKLLANLGEELEDDEREKLLLLVGSVCVSFLLTREPPPHILTFVRALASNSTKKSKLRALALATLGKICLSQGQQVGKQALGPRGKKKSDASAGVIKFGELLTRRHVSIFVHELDNPTSTATRNNAVIVLCDLCRQYTAVVEPYVPRLARLLTDPSQFVRIQVMSSLVSLLQEDYIKMRSGPILYQIAGCLLDSSESVRTTAEYALLQVASPKNPSLLATAFLELIFVLNNCTECQVYNQKSFPSRRATFHSGPPTEYSQRKQIYDLFLQGMTEEQRLRLSSRFRADVLSQIADKKLDLSHETVQNVLHDTLLLLSCDEIRAFHTGLSAATDDSLGEPSQNGDAPGKVQLSKKRALLSKMQHLELRETTIPALLELRHLLESARSPLLRVLMRALCTLVRPHKSEIESIIADAAVRAEVLHELALATRKNAAAARRGAKRRRTRDENGGAHTNEGPRTFDSPMARRVLGQVQPVSVPRTRSAKKPRSMRTRLLATESEGEAELHGAIDMEEVDEEVAGRGSMRLACEIAASPKLGSIARRAHAVARKATSVLVDGRASGFAVALAQIEGAAEG